MKSIIKILSIVTFSVAIAFSGLGSLGTVKNAQAAVSLSGNLSGVFNYAGQDVIIGNVNVIPFNGSSNGNFTVLARNITVNGTINASGTGYGGGGGGGGGGGAGNTRMIGALGGPGGIGGAGSQNGQKGFDGTASEGGGGIGGRGGNGGGSYGGAGGAGGSGAWWLSHSGIAGNIGGYLGVQINGDSSIDESVSMGSGGGAGGGGSGGRGDDDAYNRLYCIGASGGGGGSGSSGGGVVKLIASENLVVIGSIVSRGLRYENGNGKKGGNSPGGFFIPATLANAGGAGGNLSNLEESLGGVGGTAIDCSCCWNVNSRGSPTYIGNGGAGAKGSAGAGGGIFLKGVNVAISSTIDNRGGGNSFTNGGTLKIFYASSYSPGRYYTGRTYVKQYGTPPTVQITNPKEGDEFNYGTVVSFNGTATAFQGKTIVAYQWFEDRAGTLVPLSGELMSPSFFKSNFNVGDYAICFKAKDSGSLWSNCGRVNIKIKPTCEPIVGSQWCPGDNENLSGSSNIISSIRVNSLDGCTSSEKCEYYLLPINGKVGSATDQVFCQRPTENLCEKGTPSDVKEGDNGKSWVWTCLGLYGGEDTEGKAAKSCAYQEVSPN